MDPVSRQKKKSFFYNPFLQNRLHLRRLKKYLEQYGSLPTIPIVSIITQRKWKVKNCGPEDYPLGYDYSLKDIPSKTPDSELMAQHFKAIMAKLQPLSRPSEFIKEEYI